MLRSKEDSESESLVSKEVPASSYTEEGGRTSAGDTHGDIREMDYVDTDVSVLSQFHEDAISQAGFGMFQWLLFFVVGLGLMADSIEIFSVAYILPSAEKELCMEDYQKGWLGGISFVGMMIGGIVWGNLADRMGRRRTLLSALCTNAIFAILTSFMPTYGLFMVSRLCSGIGVGGSLPIVFTYYCEFLDKKNRGRHLSWMLMFWAFGGVFVSVVAWGIIPKTGFSILVSHHLHFNSWRIFLIICAIPALLAIIGLCFLPESPRFLLEIGRDVEAMFVYQRIFKINNGHKPGVEYQLSELELPTRRCNHNRQSAVGKGIFTEFFEALEMFWSSFIQILFPPYTQITSVLLVVWITTSFGFYGLSIWFPEYIKKLDIEAYRGNSKTYANTTIESRTINYTLDNIHFQNMYFHNVNFSNIVINHCIFSNCSFTNSNFTRIRSSKTFFQNSDFDKVLFNDTDFYDYKFQNCFFHDTNISNLKTGCPIDFDINYKLSEIFLQNLITQLAIIPGNILSAYALDWLGRVRTMGTSLFLAGTSAFFIWFLDSKSAVVSFQAVFNFISISGWNAVDVITTEVYPAALRSTGYGFLSAISRLAAVLGNLTFGSFIGTSKAVPILTSAAVILLGSICSVKLPETKDALM
ncbi:synaptic vesicle glycoprotein 2C-like [Centruroides vittatus]|uniref:synaptic vesicle glycoprotein 2C-like n=1 Tax=Centruroides vittatus TaxID=120091 RepID=UPI00350EBE71